MLSRGEEGHEVAKGCWRGHDETDTLCWRDRRKAASSHRPYLLANGLLTAGTKILHFIQNDE